MKRIINAAFAAVLLGLPACSDDPSNPIDMRVHEVVAGPNNRVLIVGDTMRITVYPKTAAGVPLGGLQVDWESDAENVAAVVTGGSISALVQAKAPGTTTIRATVGGKSALVAVTVEPAPKAVHHIVIAPGTGILNVGSEAGLEAYVYAEDGTLLGGRPLVWTSSNGPVLTVTSYGNQSYAMLRAQSPGSATVTVRSGSVEATAQYTVVPVQPQLARIEITPATGNLGIGGSMTIYALFYAADSTHLTGQQVQWISSNPAVLSVSGFPVTGAALLTGLSAGTVTISAISGGIRKDAVFEVFAPMPPPPPIPVAHVIVQPSNRGLWENQALPYTAHTLRSNGIELTGRKVAWSVQNPNVARVDSAGVVVAQAAGATRIYAESEGVRGYSELKVYRIEQQMTFSLTYDWYDGEIRLMEPMGTLQWTDSAGVTRSATLSATSGTFKIDRTTGTYERVINAVAYGHVGGILREVGQQTFTDHGDMYYVWNPFTDGATTFNFVSATTPGLTYTGKLRSGGELMATIPVQGGELREVLFRIAQ